MRRTLRRFPLLSAFLALSLVVGPMASSLCVPRMEDLAHESHAMEMAPVDVPCHDTQEDPSPECDAPCCIAAADLATVTVAPVVPALLVTASVSIGTEWPVERVGAQDLDTGPPPARVYETTKRIRL